MASIFKRSKRKNEPYWIQYTNHLGKWKTVNGFTDEGLTAQLASKLETEARLRKAGLVDADREQLAAKKMALIGEHLAAFEASLADNTDRHVNMTMARVDRVVAGCEFAKLADLNAEKVQSYLRSLRRDEIVSHRTHNRYVQAIDSFLNWCVSTYRLISNPLKGLERLNAATDARHPRWALTPEEVSRLVESTRKSRKRVKNLRPDLRARASGLKLAVGLKITSRGVCVEHLQPNEFA